MKAEKIPFQQTALENLRREIESARREYLTVGTPQVVSYTAPTGAGKTIIMASLIERIFCGEACYEEQPNAVFVWLSDSPELNKQSHDKIDLMANRISLTQTEIITEETFNKEVLDDGMIYFLNTQKLSKSSNLAKQSDSRQWTIWETLDNTVKAKSDRLYFIIDEAHRGMLGNKAATATTIMQKFIKGSPEDGLPAMPLVIGVSATSERFLRLVGSLTNTTIRCVTTTADEVRASGLLKDRIIIEYPDTLNNEMAVLQAATDEWMDKAVHWEQYCREQHYANVDPIFVVQVQNGTGTKTSDTDLDACLETIEKRAGMSFKEYEVVHTFGQTAQTITIGGLPVHYEEPSHISENRKIKLVFFKENLSTGWDCPRAETMMSFRRASDATYIAQLLGRMVRTPMRMRIRVDETLNDVRLFLPYFDAATVKNVVGSLQSEEGSSIPTNIIDRQIGDGSIVTLTVRRSGTPGPHISASSHTNTEGFRQANPNSPSLGQPSGWESASGIFWPSSGTDYDAASDGIINDDHRTHYGQSSQTQAINQPAKHTIEPAHGQPGLTDADGLDREAIVSAINEKQLLTYKVRSTKTRSYLNSLFDLARLLTCSHLDDNVQEEVRDEVVGKIKLYVQNIKAAGKYESLTRKVKEFKLITQVVDVYGQNVEGSVGDLFSTTDVDIERQFRQAEMRLGNEGIGNRYCDKFFDQTNPNATKIDTILFANDTDQMAALEESAKQRFHGLIDNFRRKAGSLSEKDRKKYDDISKNGDAVSAHTFYLPETIQASGDPEGEWYSNHLFFNPKTGKVRFNLNGWEKGVIEEEAAQPDFVCWLRNIPRQTWALTIPYELNNENKATYPDFIVITKDDTGGYVVNILEPHDPSRNDNLPKAKGFAKYARVNQEVGRLELVRKVNGVSGPRFKRLDLTKSLIQIEVLRCSTDEELNNIFDKHGYYL